MKWTMLVLIIALASLGGCSDDSGGGGGNVRCLAEAFCSADPASAGEALKTAESTLGGRFLWVSYDETNPPGGVGEERYVFYGSPPDQPSIFFSGDRSVKGSYDSAAYVLEGNVVLDGNASVTFTRESGTGGTNVVVRVKNVSGGSVSGDVVFIVYDSLSEFTNADGYYNLATNVLVSEPSSVSLGTGESAEVTGTGASLGGDRVIVMLQDPSTREIYNCAEWDY